MSLQPSRPSKTLSLLLHLGFLFCLHTTHILVVLDQINLLLLLILVLLIDTLRYEESSLEPEHLAQSTLQSAGSAARRGTGRGTRSATQRVLQDLATLVAVNVLDLVAVEASTAAAADKLNSVQVGHTELNHRNRNQNGCTAQASDAVDSNGGSGGGVLLLLARRGRSTAASNNAGIHELQPVLDNVDRGLFSYKKYEHIWLAWLLFVDRWFM